MMAWAKELSELKQIVEKYAGTTSQYIDTMKKSIQQISLI
jgi:hypothetical protein